MGWQPEEEIAKDLKREDERDELFILTMTLAEAQIQQGIDADEAANKACSAARIIKNFLNKNVPRA